MAGWSDGAGGTSNRRRYWVPVQATVTGNLHGADGPASSGMHRFAPSYEFHDAHGQRWLGQADIYGPDQEIIGTTIPVIYNPANPAESTRPAHFAKGRLARCKPKPVGRHSCRT